jgi:hypothetical protein
MKLKTLIVLGLLCLASLSVAMLLAYFTRWQTAIVGIIPFICGLVGFLLVLLALIAWGLAKARGSAGRRGRGRFYLSTTRISIFSMGQHTASVFIYRTGLLGFPTSTVAAQMADGQSQIE